MNKELSDSMFERLGEELASEQKTSPVNAPVEEAERAAFLKLAQRARRDAERRRHAARLGGIACALAALLGSFALVEETRSEQGDEAIEQEIARSMAARDAARAEETGGETPDGIERVFPAKRGIPPSRVLLTMENPVPANVGQVYRFRSEVDEAFDLRGSEDLFVVVAEREVYIVPQRAGRHELSVTHTERRLVRDENGAYRFDPQAPTTRRIEIAASETGEVIDTPDGSVRGRFLRGRPVGEEFTIAFDDVETMESEDDGLLVSLEEETSEVVIQPNRPGMHGLYIKGHHESKPSILFLTIEVLP